jgi:outer membrane lipoprotein-sorting protein
MKRALLSLCFLSISAYPAAKPKAAPSQRANQGAYASTLIDNLQKKWDEAKTYQARFKQIVFAKRLGTRDESVGLVSVSKPNRLRWVSETDGTLQILNGKSLTNVTENPRRKVTEVEIYPDAAKAVDSKLLKFLAGQARFKTLYKFKLDSETAEIATVKFNPLKGDGEALIAEIDKNSYLLRSLTTDSEDNRVRVEFTDIQLNVKLDSKLFEYQPKKTDVVRRIEG